MNINFEGAKALVTGSTRGIGFATVKALAAADASVVINGRSQQAVDEAAARLQAELPEANIEGVAADTSTADGVNHLVSKVPALDILVCNAATFDWTGFFDTSDDDWQRHFDINVLSGVRLARVYLAAMLKRNSGRIVLVASEAGLNIPADMIHYGVSKAAEIALARGLAELTAGTGVTVNSVLPGPTASSGAEDFVADYARSQQIPHEDAEQHLIQSIRPTSLLRRLATSEEVANMIVYACSPQASATNGAALRVEGGLLRHPG